jgi:hypothetical protein
MPENRKLWIEVAGCEGDEEGQGFRFWDAVSRPHFRLWDGDPAMVTEVVAKLNKAEAYRLALEELLDAQDVPDASCSCHLNPPCGDCETYGGLREAMKLARAALGRAVLLILVPSALLCAQAVL